MQVHKVSSFSLFFFQPVLIFQPIDTYITVLSVLYSITFEQTFPLQPQETALQAVRRCLWAVCRRTPPSSSSWRSSDSVVISPPYAKARKTSAISDLLKSLLWTRLSSCRVSCPNLHVTHCLSAFWDNILVYILSLSLNKCQAKIPRVVRWPPWIQTPN